jgi:hypothetical protein
MNEQIATLNAILIDVPPTPPTNRFPYFLRASYMGRYWKNFKETYASDDCPEIQRQIERLRDDGWQFIHIVQVPNYTGNK